MATDWLWNDDDIQLPRLLAEINAVGLSKKQYKELSQSMDLPRELIDELLDRAERRWQLIKARYCPKGRRWVTS